MKYRKRIGNLETRSCGKHLLTDKPHNTIDIVQWGKGIEGAEFCWSIAYFDIDNDGYYLKFVADRPLDKRVNWNDFKKLVKSSYVYLRKYGWDNE